MISQSKIEDKREKILLAARRLFVQHGIHSTPTSGIAREAGVSNGTLFHYFKKKEGLIITLYREIRKSHFISTIAGIESEKTIKHQLRLLWYNTVKWALNRPQDFLFIQYFNHSPFKSQLGHDEPSEHVGFYHELIDQGKRKGTLKNIPTELIYQLTAYQIDGVINYLMQHDEFHHNPTYLNKAFGLYWDSIAEK